MDNYEIVKQLGKGGLGIAYAVRKTNTFAPSGFLVLKKVACSTSAEGNAALREAQILQSLSHPNVVKYHDVFLHKDENERNVMQVCTVMEYCRSGDLAAYLIQHQRQRRPLAEKTTFTLMFQLAEALTYLHSQRILHRDLKPANVFLHLFSASDMALKLGDFGLSATLEAGKRTSRVGTPCYLAPEILFHDAYAEKVDIWGAGCVFFEMATLDFLWQRKGMLGAMVQEKPLTASDFPTDFDPDLRSLVISCLQHDPAHRPRAAQMSGGLRMLANRRRISSSGTPLEPEPDGGDWTAPLLTSLNAISQTWTSGIDSLFGGESPKPERDAPRPAEPQPPQQPMDKHGYARHMSVEEELAQAEARTSKRASGGSSSTPKAQPGSGARSSVNLHTAEEEEEEGPPNSIPNSSRKLPTRSQQYLNSMKEAERNAQIRNQAMGDVPEWREEGRKSSTPKAAGTPTSQSGKTEKTAPKSGGAAGKGAKGGKKEKEEEKEKEAAPYRQTDRQALKNHRDIVVRGREQQLQSGSFRRGGGSDLFLRCIDVEFGPAKGLKTEDLDLGLDDDFDDVLLFLKDKFGRDVVFEYELNGAVVTVERQSDFDAALDVAAQSGKQLDVVVRKARWNSTTEYFVKKKPEQRPWWMGDA